MNPWTYLAIGAAISAGFLIGVCLAAVLEAGARADECAECQRTQAAARQAGTAVAFDDVLMSMGAEGWAPPRHADPALRHEVARQMGVE